MLLARRRSPWLRETPMPACCHGPICIDRAMD
jgi:hypothetical protein